MTDLQLTRMRAIKENTVTFITFNTANETYAAFIDNGAGSVDGDNDGVLDQAFDGIQNGTERTFLNGDMPAGVDLTSTEFTANRLRFDMRGLPSEGGDVRLTGSDGGTRDVNVGMAGNIRIEN